MPTISAGFRLSKLSARRVDIVEELARFGGSLRDEGVAVGVADLAAFCDAVSIVGGDLYWAGRLTLVRRREDLPVYDRVFATCFLGAEPRRTDAPGDVCEPNQAGSLATPQHSSELAPAGEVSLASEVEILRYKSFATCTDEELRTLSAMFADIGVPQRQSRRHRPAGRGRVDMRRTLHQSLKRGAEPLERRWRKPRRRPRRVVLLLDVSGSMSAYSRALLHFAYASARGRMRWEVFCFATRLSRLTPVLRHGTLSEALDRATREVRDWDGGTRIGRSLEEFLTRYGHRGMARGAVVLICSDGLEVDDPAKLEEQMARLARLAHLVVWLNPLKSDPRYQPLALGMRAALPSVSLFHSGHNLASLELVAGEIADAVSQ